MRLLGLLVLVVAVAGMVVGCGPQNKVKQIPMSPTGNTAYTYPSPLRGAYIIKKQEVDDKGAKVAGKYVDHICSEPAPDTVMESLQQFLVKASAEKPGGPKASLETQFLLAQSAIELSGRNSTVLLARDLLYNACLGAANGNLEGDKYKEIFTATLDVVQNLGLAELNKSKPEYQIARQYGVAALTSAFERKEVADKQIPQIIELLDPDEDGKPNRDLLEKAFKGIFEGKDREKVIAQRLSKRTNKELEGELRLVFLEHLDRILANLK